jgi:hypothetical protein
VAVAVAVVAAAVAAADVEEVEAKSYELKNEQHISGRALHPKWTIAAVAHYRTLRPALCVLLSEYLFGGRTAIPRPILFGGRTAIPRPI